jgi:hypothetical protein
VPSGYDDGCCGDRMSVGWGGDAAHTSQVRILRRDCLAVAQSMIDDLREEKLPSVRTDAETDAPIHDSSFRTMTLQFRHTSS